MRVMVLVKAKEFTPALRVQGERLRARIGQKV
jgi:hypothetical protein